MLSRQVFDGIEETDSPSIVGRIWQQMKDQQKPQPATSAISRGGAVQGMRSAFFATTQMSRAVLAFTARIASNSVPFLQSIPKSSVGTNACLMAARKNEPYP